MICYLRRHRSARSMPPQRQSSMLQGFGSDNVEYLNVHFGNNEQHQDQSVSYQDQRVPYQDQSVPSDQNMHRGRQITRGFGSNDTEYLNRTFGHIYALPEYVRDWNGWWGYTGQKDDIHRNRKLLWFEMKIEEGLITGRGCLAHTHTHTHTHTSPPCEDAFSVNGVFTEKDAMFHQQPLHNNAGGARTDYEAKTLVVNGNLVGFYGTFITRHDDKDGEMVMDEGSFRLWLCKPSRSQTVTSSPATPNRPNRAKSAVHGGSGVFAEFPVYHASNNYNQSNSDAENESDEDDIHDPGCMICYDHPIDTVLIPCGHMMVCMHSFYWHYCITHYHIIH